MSNLFTKLFYGIIIFSCFSVSAFSQAQEPYYLFFDNFETDYPPIELEDGSTTELFDLLYFDAANDFPQYSKYIKRTGFGPSAFAAKDIDQYDVAVFPMGPDNGLQTVSGGIKVMDKIREMIAAGKGVLIIGSQIMTLSQDDSDVSDFIENDLGISNWGILPVSDGGQPLPFAKQGLENDPVGTSVITWCNGIFSENDSPLSEPWRFYAGIEVIAEVEEGTDFVEKFDYFGYREDPVYIDEDYYTAVKKEFENGGKVVFFSVGWDIVTKIHNDRTNQFLRNAIDWLIKDLPEPEQAIEAESTLIEFAPTEPGNTDFQQVRVRNSGREDLTITELEIENFLTDEGIFELAEEYEMPITLGPGQATSFNVKFEPEEKRTYEDALLIYSDAVNRPILTVDFQGSGGGEIGFGARISVSSFPVDFGELYLGEDNTVMIPVLNNGSENLELYDISFERNDEDAFQKLSPLSDPNVIAPGDELEIEVKFFPIVQGDIIEKIDFTGIILIQSNANNETQTRVTLKGTLLPNFAGPDAAILGGITSINFGNIYGPADTTFTIQNTGDQELMVSSIYVDGSPNIVNNNIITVYPEATVISPQDTAIVTISFDPPQLDPPREEYYQANVVVLSNAKVYDEFTIVVAANGVVSVEDGYAGYPEVYDFTVMPNPTTDNSRVEFNLNGTNSKQIKLNIIDVTGKVVANIFSGIAYPGQNEYAIPVNRLVSGTYYIVAEVDGKASQLQMVIER